MDGSMPSQRDLALSKQPVSSKAVAKLGRYTPKTLPEGWSPMPLIVQATIVVLFGLSANLLIAAGLHYTDASGNSIERIHPVFFLFAPMAAAAFVFGGAPALLRRLRITKITYAYLATMIAALVLEVIRTRGANAASGGEVSVILVSLVLPSFVLGAFGFFKDKHYGSIAVFVRLFLVANSMVGIVERVLNIKLIPALKENGTVLIFKSRASSLLGHPLTSSMITGLMLVYLLVSERGKFYRRLPEIVLHLGAMVAFAGRSAMVNIGVILVIRFTTLAFRFFKTGRAAGIARYVAFMTMLVAAGAIFLAVGLADTAAQRFSHDKGSAQTRFAAVDLLMSLNAKQLIGGVPDEDRVSLFNVFNTPTGVESAWGAWIVDYGVFVAAALMVALISWLYQLTSLLERSSRYMLLFFLAVLTTSNTIGQKSLLVSQFLVMVLGLCWTPGLSDAVRTRTAWVSTALRGRSRRRFGSSIAAGAATATAPGE
jgi:hypothetical protein